MPKSVTMTHAESSSTEFNLVKTPPYDSDADMTDEEILEGLMEITSLSPPDTLEDEPTYEWRTKKGDIILAPLSYSDLVNKKLRPLLAPYHDIDAMQLTVAYISSKVPANPRPYDIVIPLGTPTSAKAGLIFDSVVKACWVGMVKRILVNRKLGEADKDLREQVNRVLPQGLAI